MNFNFDYKVKAENLLLLTMTNTYNSMVGLVNIVFTISMMLLAYRFWSDINLFIKILIILGIILFPLLQPLFIYIKSRKIVASIPNDLKLSINKSGIKIFSEDKENFISREQLKVSRINNLVILNGGNKGLYILNSETLNGRGEDLYKFLLY